MEIRGGRWRNWFLIPIFNGFGRAQSCAIVVFHLVPCDSQDPSTQRSGSLIAGKAFPRSQEDFVDQIFHLVVHRGQAGPEVPVEIVSVEGDKFRCCFSILAQDGRDSLPRTVN